MFRDKIKTNTGKSKVERKTPKSLHPESRLFGFLNGPHGIFTNNYMEITLEYMNLFRNTGGFDMIRKCHFLF